VGFNWGGDGTSKGVNSDRWTGLESGCLRRLKVAGYVHVNRRILECHDRCRMNRRI
jgi:hypothetical protein